MEKQQEPTKNKGGRPRGFSHKSAETKALTTLMEDGEYVLVRIPKKHLAKLFLKDLI